MITSDVQSEDSQLGKTTEYITKYNPTILFPIARAPKRAEINVTEPLPFYGYDVWNAYELSWLNENGKPQVAIGEIILPCDTPNIIESKSVKLYFNSLNNTQFPHLDSVITTIKNDLSKSAGKDIDVRIQLLEDIQDICTESFSGKCIDGLDITTNDYQVNPGLLSVENESVEETLYSNFFNSICLATRQPDWASIKIQYQGKKLNREGLLKYLISYRNHSEFHEQCIERALMDILRRCQPNALTIEARFTRRGGIDINPIRSTQQITPSNCRQIRQ